MGWFIDLEDRAKTTSDLEQGFNLAVIYDDRFQAIALSKELTIEQVADQIELLAINIRRDLKVRSQYKSDTRATNNLTGHG